MSVSIRLSRIGKKDQPVYRVVVVETRSKRNGKAIKRLGSYNPNLKPPVLKLDRKEFDLWVSRGAIISDGLRKILPKEKK